MSYRWIMFAVAAVMLGVGAWYFGRPIHPKESPVEKRIAEMPSEPIETPKQLPPKVIEVVDLSSAYEPVREPESVAVGNIDPASFIEEKPVPTRIPYAADENNPFADILRVIHNTPASPSILGAGINNGAGSGRETTLVDRPLVVERVDIMPRVTQAPIKLTVMPREVK